MITLGWFGVQNTSGSTLAELILRLAAATPLDETPDDFLLEETSTWACANLGGWECAYVNKWAQAASVEVQGVCLSLFSFEGLWEWSLFERGHHVAGMDARSDPRVFLYGNLPRAAELLRVETGLLKDYCRTYPVPEFVELILAVAFNADPGAKTRARPGDKHAPWDEWANTDFADRVGMRYPEPQTGQELSALTSKALAVPDRRWPLLPSLLDARESRAWPRRTWIEKFHPRTWSA